MTVEVFDSFGQLPGRCQDASGLIKIKRKTARLSPRAARTSSRPAIL